MFFSLDDLEFSKIVKNILLARSYLSVSSCNTHFLDAVNTPSDGFNQVMTVLLSTSQFIAGAVAIFLDNTIPGTRKERGLEAWQSSDRFKEEDYDSYDIPWLRKITDLPFCKFCPISPAFKIKPKVRTEPTTKTSETNESDL